MAFKFFDRVKELSTSTGTGDIVLGGAVSQFKSFSSVFSNNDSLYYCIADQNGPDWEVGIGTFVSPNILQRTTVKASSNSNALVAFDSASLFVFNDFPAEACELAEVKNAPLVSPVFFNDTIPIIRGGIIFLATISSILNASGQGGQLDFSTPRNSGLIAGVM